VWLNLTLKEALLSVSLMKLLAEIMRRRLLRLPVAFSLKELTFPEVRH
jgi:hypothetical protein